MNPFLDSLVGKSLIGVGPNGPVYEAATKAAKGTKGTEPIVSKGLPPYGRVPGIGRVKVNGLHSKDLFDVTDSKDMRRLVPRERLMFVKSKKLSPIGGMAMGVKNVTPNVRSMPPKKPRIPKYTQPSLFDIKGRVNPNAKPPKP